MCYLIHCYSIPSMLLQNILQNKDLTCIDTISIIGINNEYKSLSVLIVMSPQWADFILHKQSSKVWKRTLSECGLYFISVVLPEKMRIMSAPVLRRPIL